MPLTILPIGAWGRGGGERRGRGEGEGDPKPIKSNRKHIPYFFFLSFIFLLVLSFFISFIYSFFLSFLLPPPSRFCCSFFCFSFWCVFLFCFLISLNPRNKQGQLLEFFVVASPYARAFNLATESNRPSRKASFF